MIKPLLESQTDQIVRRLKGGSGAEVSLMRSRKFGLFVRKAANGRHAEKLQSQVQWLNTHCDSRLVPHVTRSRLRGGAFEYDMEYLPETVTLADFLTYAQNPAIGDEILSRIFEAIAHFHRPLGWGKRERHAKLEALIQEKLWNGLSRCAREFPAFATWSDQAQIQVNGWRGQNWRQTVLSLLDNKPLLERMAEEEAVTIHGDLTFSNILVNARGNFFFIDPNPDNIFSTASMELAKMMQSIHAEYERLEAVPTVATTASGSVEYISPPSGKLGGLVGRFWELQKNLFPHLERKALYAHLGIHFARIIPYRLKRRDPKSWIYLGEMLKFLEKALE